MGQVWRTYGGVLVAWALSLPLAALLTFAVIRWRRRRGTPRDIAVRKTFAEIGAILGTVPWLWMTMLPRADGRQRHVNLRPLHDLLSVHLSMLPVQVIGNLLVFAAAGFCLPIRFRRLASVWRVVALAAVCSAAIEVLQYTLVIGRVSSVDDVLLNALGAGVCAVLSRPLWRSGPSSKIADSALPALPP